jgi:hypothetical protein
MAGLDAAEEQTMRRLDAQHWVDSVAKAPADAARVEHRLFAAAQKLDAKAGQAEAPKQLRVS